MFCFVCYLPRLLVAIAITVAQNLRIEKHGNYQVSLIDFHYNLFICRLSVSLKRAFGVLLSFSSWNRYFIANNNNDLQ